MNTIASVSFSGDLRLAPGDELARLGLPQSVPVKATADLPVQITSGRISVIVLVIAFAVVLIMICAILYYLRPEYVVGKITVLGEGEYTVKKSRKAKLIYVGNVDPASGFNVPGAEWKLMLRGFRPFEDGKKQRGVYGRMESTDAAEITYRSKNTNLTNIKWVKIERGSTIEIGDFRISFS